MTDFFIIIGIILLLLLFLYFGFKYNLTIEKFDVSSSNTTNTTSSVAITPTSSTTSITPTTPTSSTIPTIPTTPTTPTTSTSTIPTSAPTNAIIDNKQPSQLIDENIINLLAVINAYPPKCFYHPTNINNSLDTKNNILYNLVDRNNNAIITGNGTDFIIKTDSSGNTNVNLNTDGSVNTNYKYTGKSNITYLTGTNNTSIKFNNIPQNFTLCSITKYTSTQNQNTILTSTTSSVQSSTSDNNNNLWFHGHYNGLRGVVCYNKFLTNNNDNITDDYIKNPDRKLNWVITCAKNSPNSAPNNVIVNGVSIGTNQEAGVGGGNNVLSINSFNNNFMNNNISNYAFSYIIMWDVCLSDTCLKYVSDALIYYLNTGNELLYDYSSLSPDDKIIITNKTSLIINADNADKQNKQWSDWLKTQSIQNNDGIIKQAEQQQEQQEQEQQQEQQQEQPVYRVQIPNFNMPNYNGDFSRIINKFNDNLDSQNEVQQKILELLKLNLIKKEPNTNDTTTLSIDKVLTNIAYLDSQLSLKKPTISSSDVVNFNKLNKNKSDICPLVDKMPEPTQQSFRNFYDKDGPDPSSKNKDDQSYLWCKCSPDNYNTDRCKAFNTCRINYSNNNNDNGTTTFSTVSGVDKEIYNNCINAFPNFPKYLN